MNIVDQYGLKHIKTVKIREYRIDFEMVKNYMIENHKETYTIIVISLQIVEILNFCAYDNEKKNPKKRISELRGNDVLSTVG